MAFETRSAQIALALAAFFAAPATLIAAETHLPADTLAMVSGDGLAARALNKALAGSLGFASVSFGPQFRGRLATHEPCQLACRMVLAPADRLNVSIKHLAAAIFQIKLRSTVMKAEREAVTKALGEAAVQSGLREAPVFAAELSALAPYDALDSTELVNFAQAVAVSLADAQDAVLGRILAARLPGLPEISAPTEAQQAAAWRVIAGHI